MKRYLFLLLAMTLTFALLAGCAVPGIPLADPDTEPETEPEIDGGVKDSTDPNAPKTIKSTEITRFSCWFSTIPDADPGVLGNRIVQLTAERKGDTVYGVYDVRSEGGVKREFTAPASFMDELQGIAEMFDLAQHNGYSYHVSGIPNEFGATLDVEYASGEKIYASDNQDNFLSFGVMNALVQLFAEACASEPELVAVGIEQQFEDAPAYVAYPALTVDETGFDALRETITDISVGEAEEGHGAMARFGKTPENGILYYNAEAELTRSDTELVSFFVKAARYEDAGWENEMTEYRGYTIETVTGRQLGFSDVVRDMQLLPIAIGIELHSAYPGLEFYDDMMDFLKQSVESDDGNVTFALSYGFLHVFVNEYVVADAPGGLHVTLSNISYPYLLEAFYRTAPSRHVLTLDYGVDYQFDSYTKLRMDWSSPSEYEPDVTWKATVNGVVTEEDYYGYAPTCHLVTVDGSRYLYLRVPSGDVSMFTEVYRLTDDGLQLVDTVPLSIRTPADMDPDMMRMDLNEFVYSSTTFLMPTGFYRVGDDGLPEQAGSLFTLSGAPVALKQSGRYNPASRADAAASGGMWNLVAGEVLTPLQTDRETFIDFITDDGRVVRFEIDGFRDDMRLDNWGTLDDVFESPYG